MDVTRFLLGLAVLISVVYILVHLRKRRTILLYAGPGAGKNSLDLAERMLRRLLPQTAYNVRRVYAHDVVRGDCMRSAALFVMPGGADLPYCKDLNGRGNHNIKHFVHDGGAYLGLCAGAYYAGSSLAFDEGGPLQVIGGRELAFFPGCVEGPTLAPYHYSDHSGARVARLRLVQAPSHRSALSATSNTPDSHDESGALLAFFNGGGHFVEATKHDNVTVLAYYEHNDYSAHKFAATSNARTARSGLAAIVVCRVGAGTAILSGVHYEFSVEASKFADGDVTAAQKAADLRRTAAARDELAVEILRRLGLEARPPP